MTNSFRYTVRYHSFEADRFEVCVEAEHVSEAIAIARREVPILATHPGRIVSVIRGY